MNSSGGETFSHPVESSVSQHELLSSDERAMVEMVAQGWPEPEIAHHLGLGENAVREHLLVIFRKLAVNGLLDQLLYVGGKAV